MPDELDHDTAASQHHYADPYGRAPHFGVDDEVSPVLGAFLIGICVILTAVVAIAAIVHWTV